MINVLADQYLYNIQSYFPENINLQLFDPSKGLPAELPEAHALLIRTVIPINKQTLPSIPSQLSFIGTGSAGTDHVDLAYLHQNSITFADAAGCNARSVAEYVATSLLLWAESRQKKIHQLSMGVIGVGHVGSHVIDLLDQLEVSTVAFDPPKEKRDPDFTSASLPEVLNCDVLSFHTPLTRKGDFPTFHWLNEEKLKDYQFELVINTARGGVIDESALIQAQTTNQVGDLIIDVWEDEPHINLTTAKQAFIKTPHIAGYSIQAKENASKLVANALLDHFDIKKITQNSAPNPQIMRKNISSFDSLDSLLKTLHPIKEYETKLDHIIHHYPEKRGAKFNILRAEFPLRQEFAEIYLSPSYFEKYPVLSSLGFSRKPQAKF